MLSANRSVSKALLGLQAGNQAAQGLGLLSLVGSGSNPSKLSLKRVPVLCWSLGSVISHG